MANDAKLGLLLGLTLVLVIALVFVKRDRHDANAPPTAATPPSTITSHHAE